MKIKKWVADMRIIEEKVRDAFKNFNDDKDLYKFALVMAHIGDYSVRSMTHWNILKESIDNLKKERIS